VWLDYAQGVVLLLISQTGTSDALTRPVLVPSSALTLEQMSGLRLSPAHYQGVDKEPISPSNSILARPAPGAYAEIVLPAER